MNSIAPRWSKQASGDYVHDDERHERNSRNFGNSPSRMRSQVKTMIMVLRWHIFVADLKTKGIREPHYNWLLNAVKKAPGQRLEINVASFLTNITNDFITAINGKRKLK
jgi:hypothetical protein